MVQIVKTSSKGIDYVSGLLKQKKKVVTKTVFYKIPHNEKEDDLHLKIGRYNIKGIFNIETLETDDPKSELTLDNEEFTNLIQFIEENHGPLLLGAGKYIQADADLDDALAERMVEIFKNKDARKVANFLIKNKLLNVHSAAMIEFARRSSAIKVFEEKVNANEKEHEWQKWFEDNDWVLGNEIVEILDDRRIDVSNVADYLVETFDGFVDLVEIKRPEGNLKFWADGKDHDNLIPHQDLIKAITQVQNYILELEKEMDSLKTQKRLNGTAIVKPRATLIYGRSNDWGDDEKQAFRILNAGYRDLSILTYDHVLARAKRSLQNKPNGETK